jgi:hypothetical protein
LEPLVLFGILLIVLKLKIEEIEHNGEKIYLKKGWLGWRVVEPIVLKNKETGKIDWSTWSWKNFLNKKGFITLGIIILFLLIGWLAFHEAITNYHTVMSNPCQFCNKGILNLSNFTIG